MSLPRILVTGSTGQLGRCLADRQEQIAADWKFVSRHELDLSDFDGLKAFFHQNQFDVCINTAAYTAVDKAETESELAYMINSQAPAELARLCTHQECRLFHFSSDYVYDNGMRRPLREDDTLSPRSIYAKTKLEGEQNVLRECPESIVIRTSWVFSEYGHNFVKTVAGLMKEGRALKIVDDQLGCPTYAGDLADAVLVILNLSFSVKSNGIWGVYNYTNREPVSWFGFARRIAQILDIESQLTPVSTKEYGAVAQRPTYSVLDTTKIESTFGIEIKPWDPALIHVLRTIAET